tara:strand:+ start:711 stop:860 length:150 start_codon:yes stop_codon:yes gene_type:complete
MLRLRLPELWRERVRNLLGVNNSSVCISRERQDKQRERRIQIRFSFCFG